MTNTHDRLVGDSPENGPEVSDGPESEGFEPGFEKRCGVIDQHAGGAKLDHDKIDMSLIQLMPNAMTEVCRVMHFGATKYCRGGFLAVPEAPTRYLAAMFRHLFAEMTQGTYDFGDPYYDTEPGLPFKGKIRHDAQVAVNALFRLECILRDEKIHELLSENAITDFYDPYNPESKPGDDSEEHC